jgi:hypothetical protein
MTFKLRLALLAWRARTPGRVLNVFDATLV